MLHRFIQAHHQLSRLLTDRCSDLIRSERLLDYSPGFQLEFCENSGSRLGSCPYLVKSRAREPPRGIWRSLPSGTTRFFLPSSGQENGAKPSNDPESPKVPKSPNSS